MNTKNLVICSLFAAITAILAQIAIPLPGGVPLTMQTFAVSLAGVLLGSKKGFVSMVVYVLIGAIGLPVFAEFSGGANIVLGPTGGFILSFPLMAFVIGLISERTNNKLFIFLGMIAGSIVNYLIGAIQFAVVTNSTIQYAFMVAVLPFIIVGLIKAAMATVAGDLIKNHKGMKGVLKYD